MSVKRRDLVGVWGHIFIFGVLRTQRQALPYSLLCKDRNQPIKRYFVLCWVHLANLDELPTDGGKLVQVKVGVASLFLVS